jgi:hypothetical protein
VDFRFFTLLRMLSHPAGAQDASWLFGCQRFWRTVLSG